MKHAYLYGSEDYTKLHTIYEYLVITPAIIPGIDPENPHSQSPIARIELRTNGYFIRDLRGHIPTTVNGTSILEAQLHEGDIIEVGRTAVQFSYRSPEAQNLGMSSKNHRWNEQLSRLTTISKSPFCVLLLGASGTGKEVLATAIHQNSTRYQGPFVSVNCSALSETLIESELFGHVRGSFTGAVTDRKGAFEAARGGTLFLDEIGDLPLNLQSKLLRALENSEIRPVGCDRSIKTDVRVIAATHQNLTDKVRQKTFREDLYFRLNVIVITPPKLIDRLEDFDDLLYQFAKQMRVRFSFNAIQSLKRHSWPGNIRELRNTVARAAALYPTTLIEERHLLNLLDQIDTPDFIISDLKLPLVRELEKQLIVKKLAANYGNQRRTAIELGMAKSTLHDRLKAYHIDPKLYGPDKTRLSRV